MIGVSGEQLQERWRRMRGIAHGNVQFVGRDHTQSRIAIFPPELMADDGYLNRRGRFGSILDGVENARSSEKQHQHDEDRNHCPGELDSIAAINWGGLAAIVAGALAVFCYGINDQGEDHGKNGAGHGENERGQMEDPVRGRRCGSKDAGHLRRIGGRGTQTKFCSEQEAGKQHDDAGNFVGQISFLEKRFHCMCQPRLIGSGGLRRMMGI